MKLYGTTIEEGSRFFLVDFSNIIRPEVIGQAKTFHQAMAFASTEFTEAAEAEDNDPELSIVAIRNGAVRTILQFSTHNLQLIPEEVQS